MSQSKLEHKWITDAKTHFDKCSVCGLFRRNRPIFKYKRFQSQDSVKEYTLDVPTSNKANWSKKKIDCKPVIK